MKLRCIRGVELIGEGPAIPLFVVAERHSGWGGGWVARILGFDEKAPGGVRRQFLPAVDQKLSRAGNGTKAFVIEEPGVYEVEYVHRSFQVERLYFAITPSGEYREIGVGRLRNPVLRKNIEEALRELGCASAA